MSIHRYEMQRSVDELIATFKDGNWTPSILMNCISEEVGELTSEVLHKEGVKRIRGRGKDNTKEMKTEIGDVLFAIACLCNKYGYDMDECFEMSMKKFKKRDLN